MIRSDFHSHSNYSDGIADPRVMVEAAVSKGLTRYGLSDHGYAPYDLDVCIPLERRDTYIPALRALQEEYNRVNGITPESVRNAIRSVLEITRKVEETSAAVLNDEEREALMRQIEEEMISAAKELEFERAAQLRDQLLKLRGDAPMKDDMQQRRHRRRERTRKSEH